MSYLIPVLGFIFVFGLVVLIHELGHFVFAKAGDVQVDAFSIGMGPSLFSFTRGETEYKIALLPLGGYVSMAGEDPEEAGENPRAFYNKSVGRRLLILLAGCIFNFLLGYAIYVFMGMYVGEPKMPAKVGYVSSELTVSASDGDRGDTTTVAAPADGKLQVGDEILEMNGYEIDRWQDIQVRGQLLGEGTRQLRVRRDGETLNITLDPVMVRGGRLNQPRYIMGIQPFHPPRIGRLRQEGQARELGLRKEDRIRSVDGKPVQSWEQFVNRLDEKPGEHELTLERDGEVRTLAFTVPEDDFPGWFAGMGWSPPIDIQTYGPVGALQYGARETWRIVRLMYETVVGLVNQQISPQSLAGPIGIAQMTGQVSQQGFFSLLIFTAFFSINLGVINLLPIPALDGGHVLMTLPELVTGNPLPEKVVGVVNYFGVILLITLMLWVIKIDLCRFDWFTQFFGMVCR
jgi:regulator of sigma E protease